MATIPDVGSVTVVQPPEPEFVHSGSVYYSHGPVHHHIPYPPQVVHVRHADAPPGPGSEHVRHGFEESIPTWPVPPLVVRGLSPMEDGKIVQSIGVKEPDEPGQKTHIVRALDYSEPGRVISAHGTKEPEEPARPQVVRGPDCPADGVVIATHGFEEAVIWPGRPAIARQEPPAPFAGSAFAWWKYADPWTPAPPAIARAQDPERFAGSVLQSRGPELAPAEPRPGVVVRGDDWTGEGSTFVFRQVLVEAGVAPWMRPQFVWVFDPPMDAGAVIRARGFAAAIPTPDPADTVAPPYRLVAGQIFMAGAVAGQTGGQG